MPGSVVSPTNKFAVGCYPAGMSGTCRHLFEYVIGRTGLPDIVSTPTNYPAIEIHSARMIIPRADLLEFPRRWIGLSGNSVGEEVTTPAGNTTISFHSASVLEICADLPKCICRWSSLPSVIFTPTVNVPVGSYPARVFTSCRNLLECTCWGNSLTIAVVPPSNQ